MRIALETRALAAQGGGVRRYVEHILHELTRHPEHTVMQLSLSNELFVAPWLKWYVPRVVKKLQPDVVHFTKADVPRRKVVPTVVTIYDVIPLLFPEGQKTLQRWYWPGALARAARFSDAIITISGASKRDIVEKLQVAPEKITVTPLGVDAARFRPQGVRNSGDKVPDTLTPYILFVGTLEPRKNVPLLIRAFARIARDISHRLVIVGKRDNDFGAVRTALRESGLGNRIELKDFVSSEELSHLYAGADLFVWPSVYEGWGLPPLEALASGVPTIVSDGGSLPEVVGEAGVIVSFTEPGIQKRMSDAVFEVKLAEAMRAVLTDSARQEKLRAAGPQQAAKFTWAGVVEKTLEVYKKVAI